MRLFYLALALPVVAASVGAGCMDTRTASLGHEDLPMPKVAPDAASEPGGRDAGGSVTDAGSMLMIQAEAAEGGDAGVLADDETRGPLDAGDPPVSIDAGPIQVAFADAGISDSSIAHRNDERDGAREDAKGPVNPLCIAEPWHCP